MTLTINSTRSEIAAAGVLVFLLPVISTVLIQLTALFLMGELLTWSLQEWLTMTWPGFVFYGILGAGLIGRSEKFRLVTMILLGLTVSSAILGMTAATVWAGTSGVLPQVVKKCGVMDPVILPWLSVCAVIFPHLLLAVYLNRKEVRREFQCPAGYA